MSRQSVVAAAAVIWLSGSIVLLLKGGSLLWQALELRPSEAWSWLAVPAGLLIGGVKAELIFGKACVRNLDRIAALAEPALWQAYRPRFYLFLAAMILAGALLSGLAEGNFLGLLGVAVLDFSLATALFASSRHFLTRR